MQEKDQAAQLKGIGRASVGQMRELVHELTITIRPVENMPNHLQEMQVSVQTARAAPALYTIIVQTMHLQNSLHAVMSNTQQSPL